MNTQCPHCHTVFRIGQAQLEAAGGRVRCSNCRRVFDARAHLQKELALDTEPAAGERAVRAPLRQSELDLESRASGTVSGVLLSDVAAPEEAAQAQPRRPRLWLWAGINLVLLVLLLAQLIFAQRAAFAQDPVLRPVVSRMCTLVGCTLEPRRALDRIELVQRNVYAHPNVDDALIIDATFVNGASFAQPFPVLTVSLGDIRGDPLIRRNFRPGEYRPGLDPNARIAPGSRVRVTLEVSDPGRKARTFELDFH